MRYKLVPPVRNGYSFWLIADTESPIYQNFPIVRIYKDFPDAQNVVNSLLGFLNG